MFVSRFGAFTRTYRHFHRYREIAGVLLKHHFVDFIETLGMTRYVRPRRRRRGKPSEDLSRYERLRMAFEELGPTFTKLGQYLSTRPDIFSPAMVKEFEKLQDTIPPFPFADVERIVATDFGRPIQEIFASFEPAVNASASIAQVHKARTRNGDEVAVKIRRPGIRSTIEVDIEILLDLARFIERHREEAALFEPVRTVQEFARVIRRELDFTAEAANIERFAENFGDDPRLRVPRVFRELTSERVLTMEYIHGTKITNVANVVGQGYDPDKIAEYGAQLVFQQVFEHGFFHADPHPGNILVCKDNVICFLDYGMMGILSTRHRENLGRLIEGLVERDERRITTAVFRLSGYNHFERTQEIESDVAVFIQDRLYRPLMDINVGEMINELSHILVEYGIRMPADFFLLTKSLTTIEGVARTLSPHFDVMAHAEPYVKRLARSRTDLKYMGHELYYFLLDFKSLLRDLPSETREIMTLIKHGEMRLKFEHRGLESFTRSNDQISNRIAFAIVLAALVIGSSVMTLSGIPPVWHGIPVIGLVGFLISGAMAFYLLYSIIRHGKM